MQVVEGTEGTPGKVSVIAPCSNEADTIVKVIEDVQSLRNWIDIETIVVDDGSTDGSFEKLTELNGITLRRHEFNHGKGAAIATATAMAKGGRDRNPRCRLRIRREGDSGLSRANRQ